MEISTSERNKPVLSYEGHEYLVHEDKSDQKTVWRCRYCRKFKCYATITTDKLASRLLDISKSNHSHPGDAVRASVNNLRSCLRDAAGTSDASTRLILGGQIIDKSMDIRERLSKKQSLEANIRSVRRRLNNVAPTRAQAKSGVLNDKSDAKLAAEGFRLSAFTLRVSLRFKVCI